MTLVSRISSAVSWMAVASLLAIPAGAQVRHRATSPPPSGPTVRITGTATDASNGVAVENALVSSGDQSTRTNDRGQFALTLPANILSTISIDHPSFVLFKQTVTATTGATFQFALVERASVTIKTKSGETHSVDIGTAQFAYAISFSGYVRTDNANFCKSDGTDFTPDKTEFSKILGPAVPVTATQCCQFGSVMSANVEMKSGAKLLVYFKDSCSGNEVDFVGREKATGRYQYFNFADVSEIDFP